MAEPRTGPQPGSIAGDLGALVEQLGLDSFHLIGVAGGGFAAFDYTLWHPERLRSLVIAASSGQVQDKSLAEMNSRIRGPEFAALPVQLKEVSFSYMATNPDGLRLWLDIHGRSQQPGAPPQPLRTEITFAKLETIRTPTLLIAADNDLLAAPFVMRMQAAHLPSAEFILVPESGHAINWEQPEVFNRHVLSFIGRH
jgi:pimeloyl-ACP methyl ester carboxylesterase